MILGKKSLNEYFRKTKILATLGPASNSEKEIEDLIKAGVSAFRFNFSHGPHDEQMGRLKVVRKLEKKYKTTIPVLADMQGPKLRLGQFENGEAFVKKGQTFTVDSKKSELGNNKRVYLPHPEIFASLKKGTEILIDDGKVQLVVTKTGKDYAETKVVGAGRVADKKGFNIPNAVLKMGCLTPKDKKDLKFALEAGFQWIALSFVQTPEDILEAKKIIKDKAYIISKLEKPSAVSDENLEKMVELSDAIMVARGDLGVEVSPQLVPMIQKKIIRTCRDLSKPVVVATHMLESMIDNTFPTRAEASDVANAVYEGADCVMLSAETAAGNHPAVAVQTMDKILRTVEMDPEYRNYMDMFRKGLSKCQTTSDAMGAAATKIARDVNAKSVVTITDSGTTTLRLSKYKPVAPIIALTNSEKVARRLAFCSGVQSIYAGKDFGTKGDVDKAITKVAVDGKFVKKDDLMIVTMGKNTKSSKSIFAEGTTNLVTVLKV